MGSLRRGAVLRSGEGFSRHGWIVCWKTRKQTVRGPLFLVICVVSNVLPTVSTSASTPGEDVVSETPKVPTLITARIGTTDSQVLRSDSEWTLEYMTLGTWAVTVFLIYRSHRRKLRVTAVLAGVSLVAALFLSGTFIGAVLDETRQVADDE